MKRVSILVLAVTAALALGPAGAASAATVTVCPSGCSFSQIAPAIAAANSGDTIQIGAGTYSGGFTVTKSISLLGAGAASTTISGGGPVISIVPGVSVTVARVSVSAGSTPGFGGGGINNDGSSLTLQATTISGNTAAVDGGGVYNFGGTLSVVASTISGNTAVHSGGGVLATAARPRSFRAPSKTTALATPGASSTVRHRNRVRVPIPVGR